MVPTIWSEIHDHDVNKVFFKFFLNHDKLTADLESCTNLVADAIINLCVRHQNVAKKFPVNFLFLTEFLDFVFIALRVFEFVPPAKHS